MNPAELHLKATASVQLPGATAVFLASSTNFMKVLTLSSLGR